MTTKPACEMSSLFTGRTCGARAAYLVSRGRKYDAQHSCRRHLAATVDALEEGEGRPVTVEVVRPGTGQPGADPARKAAAALSGAIDGTKDDLADLEAEAEL